MLPGLLLQKALGAARCFVEKSNPNRGSTQTVPEFIVFMHNDVVDRDLANDGKLWEAYLKKLRATGRFNGGSSIGPGLSFKKGLQPAPSGQGIEGFIRVEATSAADAMNVLEGNPNYEAGGTVEIRELLQDE